MKTEKIGGFVAGLFGAGASSALVANATLRPSDGLGDLFTRSAIVSSLELAALRYGVKRPGAFVQGARIGATITTGILVAACIGNFIRSKPQWRERSAPIVPPAG